MFNEPILTIEQAKEYFRAMDCSSYHMWREFPQRYAEYKKLNISQQTEMDWLRERFDEIYASLMENTTTDALWITFSGLEDLFASQKKNLVTITRARNTRTFYGQPAELEEKKAVGHPTWYGQRFAFADETTWPAPEATATTTMTSLSGKTYSVTIEAWNDMLMKGERKPVTLPMQEHPFTLVPVEAVAFALGERKQA